VEVDSAFVTYGVVWRTEAAAAAIASRAVIVTGWNMLECDDGDRLGFRLLPVPILLLLMLLMLLLLLRIPIS